MSKNKSKTKCGLIMPISSIDGYKAEHWEEVRDIIKESLGEEDYQIDLVSNSEDSGIIQNRIVNNLYNADIVICDVSAKNPNVMFELGMRLAFDKPTIIIKDYDTNYSFDTSPIEHLEYPRNLHYSTINKFKTDLKAKTEATLKASNEGSYTTFLGHFGEFKIAKLNSKEVPESEYILSSLKSLEKQVSSLSLNVTKRTHSITPEDAKRAIYSAIDVYAKDRNIEGHDVDNYREDIASHCISYLINHHGVPKHQTAYLMNQYFDTELMSYSIPF